MAGFGRTPHAVFGGASDFASDQPRGIRLLPVYMAGLAAAVGAALGMSGGFDTGHLNIQRPSLDSVSRESAIGEATLPNGLELPLLFVSSPLLGEPVIPDLRALMELPTFMPVETGPVLAPAAIVPIPPPLPAPAPAAPVTPPPPAVAVEPAAVTSPAKPNFYMPDVRSGPMTDPESRLFRGINAERAAAGLPAFAFDAGLGKVARTRSQQMLDQDYFGHVDPFGYSMYVELLARFGYTYAWAGENLALNNYGLAESPERAVASLMKSPTHRANILAGDFFRVGIGEVTAPDGRHFYAMIFLG
jgi:uncharacterized protein YkwD